MDEDLLQALRNEYGVSAEWVEGAGHGIYIRCSSDEATMLEPLRGFMESLTANPKQELKKIMPIGRQRFDVTSQASLLIGRNGSVIKHLQQQLDCRIKTVKVDGRTYFEAESWSRKILDEFTARMTTILEDPMRFRCVC